VFRQVVAMRWLVGVTDDEKSAFNAALAGLRAIPELSSLRFADDARHFEGNFDLVAVMDFPDFAAARRYVADERHQAYIREFAGKLIGERVVVQHDWSAGDLAGVHHVTLPVSDVARSCEWYALALGLVVLHDAIDGGAGEVTMVHPSSSIKVALRHDPRRAQALAGFDAIAFTVATIEDLDSLIDRLDARGVTHGAPTPTGTGVSVDIADPDGLVVQLTTLLP
jgi:catechol 2,3-dioxygenase-like lactoylglutathione lyase family enzyme